MIALLMGKGAANQAVPRFRGDMHSRESGNAEAPQKPSAFARRNVPTKALRSDLSTCIERLKRV